MSKLFFRHGAMGSSKTANALMVQYNYSEKGQNAVLFKPATDTRDGVAAVKSRMGLEANVFVIQNNDNVKDMISSMLKEGETIDCIIVDESQFLTADHILQLSEVVDDIDIPVICYGLRTDFMGNLFEGSKKLMEFANVIEEVKTICWCGSKAIMNARVVDGNVVKHGEQIQIGGNESYVSLCRKHWKSGKLGEH